MKKLCIYAFVLIGLIPAALCAQVPTPVVLTAARLFDGKSAAAVQNGMVIIEGGKITAAGAGLAVPAGAQVIDLGDATLLPGLIDTHVHLASESSDNVEPHIGAKDQVDRLQRTVAESAIRATAYARRTVEAGFTTVRNVGAAHYIDVGLRNAIRGFAVGPRMLVSVYQLGARGGHCDETGYPYNRFGRETGIAEGIAAGPDQFRDAVRTQVKYGANVIKVCATGGVLSRGDEVDTPQVTQEEMNAIVDEAHRLRKRVAAHAHGKEGAKVAIRAGVDSIEHGSFLDDEALKMMQERGTYLVPTFMAVYKVSDWAKNGGYDDDPEIKEKALQVAAKHAETMQKAVRMGLKIAFGTDSSVSPHGRNAQEFQWMVAAGMSPASALRAATSVAAELLGLSQSIGTLEKDKEADVIAVPGDPLADIRQMEKVRFVMKGGKLIRHDSVQP
jgi:imidazolonepropionase-like amidohydrolase